MSEGNGNKPELNNAPSATLPDKKVKLKAADISNAFFKPRSSSPTDQLVMAGDDPLDIAMRSALEGVSDGSILAVSMAAEWADLERYEYEAGKKGLLFNLAARTSVNGLAREQLVKAIIGDKEFRIKRNGSNFFNKIQDYAFGGDGKDEK